MIIEGLFKMKINLSIQEWDYIADWIKKNTCGCIYENFRGLDLRNKIHKEVENEL